MRSLRAAGIDDLAVVHGYKGDRIKCSNVEFIANPRWETSNMVSSLFEAREWVHDSPVVMSYTDIVYGSDVIQKLLGSDKDITIAVDTNWLDLWSSRFDEPLSDAETLEYDARGMITDIGRNPSSLEKIQGQYMGLVSFSQTGWSSFLQAVGSLSLEQCDGMDMTSLLRYLIEMGEPVYCVPTNGNWGEVDSQSDLQLYERMLKDGRLTIGT